jgi:H+/Cl- antiporter ClcA
MEQDASNKNPKQNSWKRYLPMMILAVVGAIGGYLYYRFVGCVSGTCPLTSNPYISTVYGGVLGALIGNIITPGKKKEDQGA